MTAGLLVVAYGEDETIVARQGDGVLIPAGTRMKMSWPGPCQYVPICLPAFSPALCHREDDGTCVKTVEDIDKLDQLHAKSGAGEVAVAAVVETRKPQLFKAVDVVAAQALTITEYHGNVASKNVALSACLVTVVAPCEEAYQCPQFDEYVLVTAGSVLLKHGDGCKTVVRQRRGLVLKAGEGVKWTWPGPCQHVAICLPAFTPSNCGREAEAWAAKDEAAEDDAKKAEEK